MAKNDCLMCYFNLFTANQSVILLTDEGAKELGSYSTAEIAKKLAELCEEYEVSTVRLVGDHTYLDRIADRIQEAPAIYGLEKIKKIKTEIY